jgi:hypothetical protein
MRFLLALLLIALGLVAGAPAWAARGAEVAVAGVHVEGQSDDQALGNAEAIIKALDGASGVVAVPPGELRSRLSGRESLVVEGAFLGNGRDRLEEGRLLYDRADLAAAIPVLDDAVEALTGGLAGAPDTKDLVDALVLLGLSHLFTGDPAGATGAFERVVVLDPTRELDPVNYPPKAVQFFTDVRRRVLDAKPAELFVEMPGDARLYVDGKQSLSTAVELPPGPHYVLVEGAEGQRAFQAVVLEAGARKRLKMQLHRAALARAGSTPEARAEQTARLYSSLGRHAGTGLILVAGETPDGEVALQLYEPRTGNFSKAVTAESDGDPVGSLVDLVPVLAGYVSEQGTLRADRVSPRTVALDVSANPLLASMLLDPEPIVETVTVTRDTPWYVWAGVAALAAGGAATAAILLTQEGEPDEDPTQKTTGVIVIGPMP